MDSSKWKHAYAHAAASILWRQLTGEHTDCVLPVAWQHLNLSCIFSSHYTRPMFTYICHVEREGDIHFGIHTVHLIEPQPILGELRLEKANAVLTFLPFSI